jgi:hypothetical protein
MKHKGLNQLLCAAVVNERFRDMLLHHPARAIAMGYLDHTFPLTPEEHELVMGIRAERLEDFAAAVHGWISGNGRDSALNAATRQAGNVLVHAALCYPEPVEEFVRVPVAA